MNVIVSNLDEMNSIAQIMADYLIKYPRTIFLDGELGVGKTTFTQMLAKYLGVKDYVVSPTFTIMKRYEGDNLYLNHFDLYRIKNDVYDLGFEEYWYSNDINIIEWATYLSDEFNDLTPLYLSIEMSLDDKRIINIDDKEFINWLKEHDYEFIR